jgi:hypothetical protein
MAIGTKLIGWIIALIVLIAALLTFQYYYVEKLPFVGDEVTTLDALQEKQFQLFLEMNHLLVTLASLTLGAIGAFVFNRYKSGKLPTAQIALAVFSWLFAGLSLLAGYLAYEKVIWMLKNKFFDLSNPQISWVTRGQFWFFIASLFFLGPFLYYGLHRDVPPEDPPKTSQGGVASIPAAGAIP